MSEADPPRKLLHSDLCDRVFAERKFGYRAEVVFRYPLTATDDPLVWEYHPGFPAKAFVPTVRVIFAESPASLPSGPVVIGTVSRIDPDARPRKSRHLGVVVISDARLVSSSP